MLSVARHLRTILAVKGRYDVHMTRASDVFVSLDRRLAISRRAGASLFISIHADAIGAQEFAQSVRGATVYTLSEQASSKQAQLLADKENAADIVAGAEFARRGGIRPGQEHPHRPHAARDLELCRRVPHRLFSPT